MHVLDIEIRMSAVGSGYGSGPGPSFEPCSAGGWG